jgi:hypothetical protein
MCGMRQRVLPVHCDFDYPFLFFFFLVGVNWRFKRTMYLRISVFRSVRNWHIHLILNSLFSSSA